MLLWQRDQNHLLNQEKFHLELDVKVNIKKRLVQKISQSINIEDRVDNFFIFFGSLSFIP